MQALNGFETPHPPPQANEISKIFDEDSKEKWNFLGNFQNKLNFACRYFWWFLEIPTRNNENQLRDFSRLVYTSIDIWNFWEKLWYKKISIENWFLSILHPILRILSFYSAVENIIIFVKFFPVSGVEYARSKREALPATMLPRIFANCFGVSQFTESRISKNYTPFLNQ